MYTDSGNWRVVTFLFVIMAIPAIPAAFLIAIVAMGSEASAMVSGFVNVLHFQQPLAVFVHGGAGIVFFLTMPLQFAPTLRKHRWHRVSGRISVVSGYVMAASAIWMHLVLFPGERGAPFISLVIMSVMLCLAFTIALHHILRRNVSFHRIWVMRAVAITLAAVTPIFIEAIAMLLLGSLESIMALVTLFLHDYGRLLAIMINLLLVELVMMRGQTIATKAKIASTLNPM